MSRPNEPGIISLLKGIAWGCAIIAAVLIRAEVIPRLDAICEAIPECAAVPRDRGGET